MGATTAAIISGVLKVVGVLADYLSRKQLIDAGKSEATADALTRKDEANAKAETAREAVRSASLRNVPDSVPDDEFQRD